MTEMDVRDSHCVKCSVMCSSEDYSQDIKIKVEPQEVMVSDGCPTDTEIKAEPQKVIVSDVCPTDTQCNIKLEPVVTGVGESFYPTDIELEVGVDIVAEPKNLEIQTNNSTPIPTKSSDNVPTDAGNKLCSEETSMSIYYVWDESRTGKKAVKASSFRELVMKASEKFGIRRSITLTLLDGTEVDEDVYQDMPNHGPDNPYVIKTKGFLEAPCSASACLSSASFGGLSTPTFNDTLMISTLSDPSTSNNEITTNIGIKKVTSKYTLPTSWPKNVGDYLDTNDDVLPSSLIFNTLINKLFSHLVMHHVDEYNPYPIRHLVKELLQSLVKKHPKLRSRLPGNNQIHLLLAKLDGRFNAFRVKQVKSGTAPKTVVEKQAIYKHKGQRKRPLCSSPTEMTTAEQRTPKKLSVYGPQMVCFQSV